MFLFQVILLASNGEVIFNALIATIAEARWPDTVFKSSKVSHLVTRLFHLSYEVPAVEVLPCEYSFVDHIPKY